MKLRGLRLIAPGGLTTYAQGLRLQEEAVSLCLESGVESLILLEHTPCYTAGRKSHNTVKDIENSLRAPIYKASRGGQITYHGPGQLVAYPILNLENYNKSLHWYVGTMEKIMIATLIEMGIPRDQITADRDRVGIWIGNMRKIGFVGFYNQKWITSHGVSLNITEECLPWFQDIVPCGLDNVIITSVEQETKAGNVSARNAVSGSTNRHDLLTLVVAALKVCHQTCNMKMLKILSSLSLSIACLMSSLSLTCGQPQEFRLEDDSAFFADDEGEFDLFNLDL